MKTPATVLLSAITQSMPLLMNISDEVATVKPAPGKWSYKEIIGHLIDSACNNQQKFVRTMMEDGVQIVPYAQNEWVALQHYNAAPWSELLSMWQYYNRHIAHIMQHIDASLLQNKLYIGGKGPYTLEFIVADYPEHLKHHLKAILPEASFLQNNFNMVY